MMPPADTLATLAKDARAWPFEEARRILQRVTARGAGSDRAVVFETGYGPSGLPHIGTFGEVVRTGMVRHAFEVLSEGRYATRLLCFSDDMDGLRKVPDNVPNRELLARHLDKPLSSVPDPFADAYPSYAAHNNAMLRRFLDRLAIPYEFLSATECYQGGLFDATLLRMLAVFDTVLEIILPTLGPERADGGRLAALCVEGQPGAVHVPEAEGRQEAVFRRNPEDRRRISGARRPLPR